MKLCPLAFLLALLPVPIALPVQDPPAPDREALRRLTADVAWLADDELRGRRAGTGGEMMAAEGLVRRLEEIGLLEPAGSDGFLQPFTVPLDPRDGGGSRIEFGSVFGDPDTLFAPDSIAPLTASERGEARGPLVFRGFGIVAPDREWDDYGDADVKGAIVLVIDGEPSGGKQPEAPAQGTSSENPHGPTVIPGGGWGPSASVLHKIMNAKRRGAVGVLLAPHPDRLHEPIARFDPSRDVRAGLPALAIRGKLAARLVPDFDYEGRARALAEANATDRPDLLAVKEPAEILVFADVVRETGTATNVLARIPGRGGPTVVVGAHFDHLGLGGSGSLAPGGYGRIHNGADDNASGTAAVLEIGRRLKQGEPPAGDVILALWSGEELGLLGSAWCVDHPTIPLDRVRANVNLDMVGRAGNGKLAVLGAGTSAAFAGWMEELGRTTGLTLDVNLGGAAIGGSDHMSFLKKEIPALHLFSGLHADYHKPTDDAERFEPEGAARVVELSLALVARIQAEPELAYVKPAAGETPAGEPVRSRWSVRFGSMPDYAWSGTGLKLAGTSPGGPAERAGLIAGDHLLQVGDVQIATIHDFMYALQTYKPGDVVLTRFLRGEEEQRVRVTLEAAGN